MHKSKWNRILVSLLSSMLLLSAIRPATALAEDAPEETSSVEETEEAEVSTYSVETYEEFLTDLRNLQGYAEEYAKTNTGLTANALVINYIRTGVTKYTTESWKIMAGPENTGFVEYVAQQDQTNGTEASGLRNITVFKLEKNGWVSDEQYDFRHMFGLMDIVSYNGDPESYTSDMGGWAGDLTDLITYVHNHCETVSDYNESNIDEFAKLIGAQYLHLDVDGEDSFGDLDIRADLDGYYLMKSIAGGNSLYETIYNYYNEDLTDSNRAAFFLNTKFSKKTTREDIRSAMLQSYESNQGCKLLEADRLLSDLPELEVLRKGSVYAFADYLYDLAKDLLISDDPEEPTDPEEPGEYENNKYYTVFSSKQSTLAPGITQHIKYATTADNKQIVYYLATADLNNQDVHIYANYGDNDGSQAKTGVMRRVSDQMIAAEKNHSNPEDAETYIPNYKAIVGVNADFYNMSTGVPSGVLIMEPI